MINILGHPGLRLLFRLKLAGGVRKQGRRLKQPKHWVFLILGALAAFSWIFGVFFSAAFRKHAGPMGPEALPLAQVSMLVIFTLTIMGAFNYRGLYLPKDEIEMAFSAPISRSDLVRYRLMVNWMKSLFAALLLGVGWATRAEHGLFAFVGVFVAMMTFSVVGQAAALFLGGAENRIGKWLKHIPTRVLTRILVIVVLIGFFMIVSGKLDPRELVHGSSIVGIAGTPVVHALLLPFTPWARMITAETFAQFAPLFLFAVGFWILLFEATVNIKVDFRELSLATSADVAKRVSRIRRGTFHAGQAQVTRATIGWRVPWLFGHGAFGAIAWHKTAAIVRRSRGALIFSILIIAFLTILGTVLGKADEEGDKFLLGGSMIIAVVGTLYMCAGLRFDFRTDLEIMDRIKTWPLRPSMVFLATILPEVVLVSSLLFLAVLGRSIWLGWFHPAVVGVLVFQPLVTLTWVALDNATFLFSPIRYSPGEEGALQNMGRSMLLMLLRGIVLFVVILVAGLPAWGTYALVGYAGNSPDSQWWAAGAVAWFGLLAVDFALVLLGGRMLARYDVARDRPL